jgi:membrane protein YqaA with SNARE-associated domain
VTSINQWKKGSSPLQLQDIADWMRTFASVRILGDLSYQPNWSHVSFRANPLHGRHLHSRGLRSGGGWAFDPLLIAVAAGTGAAVGEFSGYLIGLGGRKVIGEKYKKKMDFLVKLFKRFGPVVIFVFALTSLPDDLLFIPFGVMRYSVLQAFIPALLGKFFSNLIIAYSGRLSLQIIKDIFGVEGEGMSALIGIILVSLAGHSIRHHV